MAGFREHLADGRRHRCHSVDRVREVRLKRARSARGEHRAVRGEQDEVGLAVATVDSEQCGA